MKDFMFMDDKYRSIRHFEVVYYFIKCRGQIKRIAYHMNLSLTHTNRLLTEFQDDNALDNRIHLALHCGQKGSKFSWHMTLFYREHSAEFEAAREASAKLSRRHREGARHV